MVEADVRWHQQKHKGLQMELKIKIRRDDHLEDMTLSCRMWSGIETEEIARDIFEDAPMTQECERDENNLPIMTSGEAEWWRGYFDDCEEIDRYIMGWPVVKRAEILTAFALADFPNNIGIAWDMISKMERQK